MTTGRGKKTKKPSARDVRFGPLRAAARNRLAADKRTPAEIDRARLEAKYGAAIRAAEAEAARAAAKAKWSHKWEGTPETHEAHARATFRGRHDPLGRMHALGKITADELAAAHEIASVAEMIERSVSVRIGSLEARVDCSSSSRDALVESLGRIRMEVAYRAWRKKIPHPRRMILDMVLSNVPYVRLANSYHMHWRTARRRLITALRMWPEVRMLARYEVDREDVFEVYRRIGEGTLLAPKPKPSMPSLAEDEAA